MYILIDCIFWADHISLHKLDLMYILYYNHKLFYMYYCSDLFHTVYVVIYWQVLYQLWWIPGILNKWLWLWLMWMLHNTVLFISFRFMPNMRRRRKVSQCIGSTIENSCCPKEQTLKVSNHLSVRMGDSQLKHLYQPLRVRNWSP